MTEESPEVPLDSSDAQITSESPKPYNPVEEALKKLTYADKSGIEYFSQYRVEGAMTDWKGINSQVYENLEELVSHNMASKIVGRLGSEGRNKVYLYRYK